MNAAVLKRFEYKHYLLTYSSAQTESTGPIERVDGGHSAVPLSISVFHRGKGEYWLMV